MANDKTVGFIGLGTMGARMAGNLQKAGYKLVVNDLRKARAPSSRCRRGLGRHAARAGRAVPT